MRFGSSASQESQQQIRFGEAFLLLHAPVLRYKCNQGKLTHFILSEETQFHYTHATVLWCER